MNKKGIFITGTDTGVGKTHIGTAISMALVADGVDVGIMKPVETGCRRRNGRLIPRDALRLMQAVRSTDPLDRINPYRFSEPLAPAVAAAREGKVISLEAILSAYRALAKRRRFLVVEGAGGIMVPLSYRVTYLDLAARLRLPVLVVARSNLGTINHTVLTVMALRRRKVPVAGIVLNDSTGSKHGIAERTNAAVIVRLTGVPVVGEVRHGQKDLTAIARRLLAPSC